MQRLFLLSPAKVTGVRARLLLNPKAQFVLARRFQTKGLPLADVFTFASGLYFRGKIAYARRFADRTAKDIVRVITSNRGLLAPSCRLRPEDLASFGETDIDATDPGYNEPLRRDALALRAKLAPTGRAILLGSIATAKYRDVLLEVFGDRLVFPKDFIGRGDMSRGALLLHASRGDAELPYTPVLGVEKFSGKRASSFREALPASDLTFAKKKGKRLK